MPERFVFNNQYDGELALLLNNFRFLDKRRNSSHLDLYLTNRCDRNCFVCYTNSSPLEINTNLDFGIARSLLEDFCGIDYSTLTGGEVSLLKDIDNLIIFAGKNIKKVFVQTNAIGFVRPASFRSDQPVWAVYKDLESRFQNFPNNVEIDIPITEFHDNPDLGGKTEHGFIVEASAKLAHEWQNKDKPLIRFIAKRSPSNTRDIEQIINALDLWDYGKTGMDNYPGYFTSTGRGMRVEGTRTASNVPNQKSDDKYFEGGFAVNFQGVYVNEGRLLWDLLPIGQRNSRLLPDRVSKICSIENETSYWLIKDKIRNYLLSQSSPTD